MADAIAELQEAIKSGEKEKALKIISALTLEEQNQVAAISMQMLFDAVKGGHTEIVRHLLGIPAVKEDFVDHSYNTIVDASTVSTEIFKLLFEIPAIKEKAASYGNSALRKASDVGNTEVVKILLNIPDVINNATAGNNEALALSEEGGHTEISKLLLKIPAVKAFQLRRKAANFLGISDKGSQFNPLSNKQIIEDNTNNEKFEASIKTIAISDFKDAMSSYTPSEEFAHIFNEIKNSMSIVEHIYSDQNKKRFDLQVDKYLKYYQMNKPVIIPSGWRDHSITIAAIGNFLVVGNRGQGMHPEGGCVIYRLKQRLNKEDIEFFADKQLQSGVRNRIENLTLPDPIILPLKEQKYGTCSIANKKAMVAGMLPLLKHLRTNSEISGAIPENILESARIEYKKFTAHTRVLVLDEILNDLKDENLDKNKLLMALRDFINQHLDVRKASEVRLLSRLVEKMPADLEETFLNMLTPDAKHAFLNIKESKEEKNPNISNTNVGHQLPTQKTKVSPAVLFGKDVPEKKEPNQEKEILRDISHEKAKPE